MGQAVWTGSISFGLVNIPVRLYPATEPKDVRFHLYDRRTGKRVRYERVTRTEDAATFEPEAAPLVADDATSRPPGPVARPVSGGPPPAARPVETADVVRGVELPSGDLVTVSEPELVSIAPERSRSIEIEEFVDLAEIDPVFYEKSYHVGPVRGVGADKPYVLLLRRSEEHTSELQSPYDLVCRLLLEKKKKQNKSKILRKSPGFGLIVLIPYAHSDLCLSFVGHSVCFPRDGEHFQP